MNRYCFRLAVDPTRLDDYRASHAAVWPEMLDALHAAGWRNYSLYLDDDGLLIGYFEAEGTFEQVQAAMQTSEVNARWQASMRPLFGDLESTPDTGLKLLEEVFNLEDQRRSHAE